MEKTIEERTIECEEKIKALKQWAQSRDEDFIGDFWYLFENEGSEHGN